MGWGRDRRIWEQGLCPHCGEEKLGTTDQKVKGEAWSGSVTYTRTIAVCINKKCPQRQKSMGEYP